MSSRSSRRLPLRKTLSNLTSKRHWLSQQLGRPTPPRRRRLRLEPLEIRALLATITVTSLDDNTTVDTNVTLREAIEAANTNAAVDGSTPGDVGADTIEFAPSLTAGGSATITLGGSQLPTITEALTISGPGADDLTIDANRQSRIFDVSSGSIDVTLSGMTLTGGQTTDEDGGAIRFGSSGTLTVIDSTITGNTAMGDFADGGGIRSDSGAVSVSGSTLTGNSAGSFGGGISSSSGAVSVSGSTLTDNSAGDFGGGIDSDSGAVSVSGSTLTGNSAGFFGGGIFVFDSSLNPTFTIQSSIVAGNTADSSGADFQPDPDSTLTVTNSLIGDNSDTTLTASATPDGSGNLIGTSASPIDALLAPLADNGGPTKTHALLVGSPAIDAGSNALATSPNDQRGSGFPRIVDGDGDSIATVDIGAFESPLITTSIAISPDGDLVIRDELGVDDELSIRFDDTTDEFVIHDPNNLLGLGGNIAGATGHGTNTLRIPATAITGNQIIVDTQDGSDSLTVDFSDGDPLPSGGLTFTGGESSGDNDTLTVNGYTLDTADGTADLTVNHSGPESGNVQLAGLGTITFAEIEPLTLGGTAADLVINLPNGADAAVVLSDDGTAGDGVSQIDGGFEITSFANPTNSLTINTGSGVKAISVRGLDSMFAADLTIDDGDATHDDTVTFEINPTSTGGGGLTVTVGTVSSTANLVTTSSTASGASGDVAIQAETSVTLAGGIATTGAAAHGDGGSVDIATANGSVSVAAIDARGVGSGNGDSIAITAGGTNSDITVNGDLTTNGSSISLFAADSVMVAATMISAGSSVSISANNDLAAGDSGNGITMDSGSSITVGSATSPGSNISLTASGSQGGSIETGAMTSHGGSVIISAAVDVTAAGAIMSKGIAPNGNGGGVSINTTNGDITVDAIDASGMGTGSGGTIEVAAGGTNSDVTIGGSVATNGTGTSITVSAADSVTVTATGSLSASGAGGSVSVTSNTDAAAGDDDGGITMESGSSITVGSGSAAGGSISLTSTGAGGGPIQSQALTSHGGSIDLSAAGDVNADGAISSTGIAPNGDGGDISISTTSGSITINTIDASAMGTGTAGNVTLTTGAGGQIVANAAGTDVTAGTLSITAGSVGDDGIGSSANPLRIDVTNLNTNTSSGNGNQYLFGSGTTTIDAGGLSAGTGTIRFDGGTFSLSASNLIDDDTAIDVNGGILDLQGFDETVAGVQLSSGEINGTGSLTSTTDFDVRDGVVRAVLAGSVGLQKTTAGTVDLHNDNTFTETTVVNAGVVRLVDGSVAAGAEVNSGGTLEGDGSIGGPVNVNDGGTFSPGLLTAGAGMLGTGNLQLLENSTFLFTIEAGGNPADVTGTVTLDNNVILDTQHLGTFATIPGETFTIIENDSDDAVSGTFADLPEAAVLKNFGDTGRRVMITYVGGSGNDVVLTVLEGFLVDNDSDVSDGNFNDGEFSLREAIELSNLHPRADIITFESTLHGETIVLAGTQLPTITEPLTIDGPGVGKLTIDADGNSRIFALDDSDINQIEVGITGVTLTGGHDSDGGAIFSRENLTVTDSTITGNTADNGGGGIHNLGTVTVSSSTLSGNNATVGGGIHNKEGTTRINGSTLSDNSASNSGGGIANDATLIITNSTLANNSADTDGGGVDNRAGSVAFITSTTIAGNSAVSSGGGLENSGSATLHNTIVVGNTSSDIGGSNVASASSHNLVGDDSSAGGLTDGDQGNIVGVDWMTVLENDGDDLILKNNGGPTNTIKLIADSPAIDAGRNLSGPSAATDQRGFPFVRTFDDAAVDAAGSDRTDIGAYERQTLAAEFFVVTTLADEVDYINSDVSLREAINNANGSVGANTITFEESLTAGGPETIELICGELLVTEAVDVQGPGQDSLTIDAQGKSRIFNLDDSNDDHQSEVEISGLTLTGGSAEDGGAIFTAEDLMLSRSTISGNTAANGGGGIFNDGTATVTDSTISDNTAYGGGGVYNDGTVTVTDSTISGNTAADGGGGIHNDGTVTVTGSTISDNTGGSGGGLLNHFGTGTVNSSMITGNSAGRYGGGIYNYAGTAIITGSTISGNSANLGGGIINLRFSSAATVTITGSTISGNSASSGGGVLNAGTAIVTGSTISGNTAGNEGGGIFNGYAGFPSGTAILHSTIVAGNRLDGGTPSDIEGDKPIVPNSSFNLIGDAASAGGLTDGDHANIVGVDWTTVLENDGTDPTLQDNGGLTETIALITGSPAIDAGKNLSAPPAAFDQRGLSFSRTIDDPSVTNATDGDGTDIGAFEVQVTLKVDPIIIWNDPADIVFGTPLGDTQLNAVADVPGTFVYTPLAGTRLAAGEDQALSVVFTPVDTATYNEATAEVLIDVLKADPIIAWSDPNDITFGTLLSDTQLNATASVDGTFVYDPADGTNLNAGLDQTLSATFTPTDAANYNNATATVSIDVLKADPIITWNDPADITFGTALSDTQLNATADVDGTFVYTPTGGTVLNAGANQTLAVAFTPTDAANYNSETASVLIDVLKADPIITWNNPADIAFGTPLGDTQLSATANIDGTFVYDPASGTVLDAGLDQTLSVAFTPTDAANYNDATATVSIDVLRADPIITWNDPAEITFGTSLSDTQLSATANIDGTFAYDPASGTILDAGLDQTLSVAFTPTDAANYNDATATVSIDVLRADPIITWNDPAEITFGTSLSDTQLSATASVDGTFAYDPASGTILDAGLDQTLSVTFTPTDAANYNDATASVLIDVLKADPIITWIDPADITFGTPLGDTQLNATANVDGTFVYLPTSGTLLNAGADQPLSVTFTPTDAANYNDAIAEVLIDVLKADPIITWSDPADITFGTPLGDTQLNATANTDGTFVYTPTGGTVLNAGANQTLSVAFTPTDAANYNDATAQVLIDVLKADPIITWSNPADITFGTPLGDTQLNATANTDGTFVYTPASGTVLNAGADQPLGVAFKPTNVANYNEVTAEVLINVLKADPIVTWSDPADITFGTPLSDTQLNATANVAGAFEYTPASGTVLNAGSDQTLSAAFTPTDTVNYNTATAEVLINVLKVDPVIAWSNPADITFGTLLSDTQLNATADVAGTFVYTPSSGTQLDAGANQTLSVAFTPTDTVNYNNASADVLINVLKADPVISWSAPADIAFGTPLGDTQLNATANIAGTFVYTPASGTLLDVGDNQTLSVAFTPTDTVNYNNATADVLINVLTADPIIAWSDPADITFGTALSDTQLNATANVAGTFVYTPAAGTQLDAGDNQTLSAVFTPTDTVTYNSVTADVLINVLKADPVLAWANPADIVFGTALGDTQLNATADVAGTFAYTPAAGTQLDAGDNQTLSTVFTPTDTVNYNSANAEVLIDVLKANPVISWSNPADIGFGTPLGDTQLNATANIAGTFVYTPPAGTELDVGDNQTLSVAFTPINTANYNNATADVLINVLKSAPIISWSDPADITFGTLLGDTQLNATADVDGTFVYTPAAGTLLDAGDNQTLNAVFTPTDTVTYNSVTANVLINVLKADPVIAWTNPADITFGTLLTDSQLNATANVAGSFVYTPASGTQLDAGQNQTLSVAFTPTDTVNYDDATADVLINVLKADASITWNDPADITFGTPLGSTQLNATANVPGTFVYTPPSGTILSAGADLPLNVDFTPTDAVNYNDASASVSINVIAALTLDFGDAPTAAQSGFASDYPVTLAQDGARHDFSALILGSLIDGEDDGQPDDAAGGDGTGGDDHNGEADEDGAFATASILAAGTTTGSSFMVTPSAAGKLDAWLDFNQDGDWDDVGEQIFTSVDVNAGPNLLSFTVPADAVPGTTFSRFRISSVGGLSPTGAAEDGEVEDYRQTILDGTGTNQADILFHSFPGGAITVVAEGDDIVIRAGTTELFRGPSRAINSIDSADLSDPGDSGGSPPSLSPLAAADPTGDMIDIRGEGEGGLTLTADDVLALSRVRKQLTVGTDPTDKLDTQDDRFEVTGAEVVDGELEVIAKSGDATIRIHGTRWTHPITPLDVDNSGFVAASDALQIINELSRRRSGAEYNANLQDYESVVRDLRFLDPNGDGRLTTLDALHIINALVPEEAGESEAPINFRSVTPSFESESTQTEDSSTVLADMLEAQPVPDHPAESGSTVVPMEVDPSGGDDSSDSSTELNAELVDRALRETSVHLGL